MTRIIAWLNTMKLGLILGFVLGAAWLLFLGIPVFQILPSYVDLRVEVAGYRSLEEEATDTIDKAETFRAEENALSVEALSDERDRCSVRIDNITQSYEAAIRAMTEENPNEEPSDGTRRVSVRELLGYTEELQPAGDR